MVQPDTKFFSDEESEEDDDTDDEDQDEAKPKKKKDKPVYLKVSPPFRVFYRNT